MNLWHTKTIDDVAVFFSTSKTGLTKRQVESSRDRYGTNTLPEKKPDSVFLIFFRQFKSPLIYILLGSSALIFLLGDYTDGVIILFVLFFNAVIGTIQEGKAQNTLFSLKKFTETEAVVIRDGIEEIIPDTEVVVGDIIVLREGGKVPADARIIESSTLALDEASLTGESEPVYKIIEMLSQENLSSAEQKNMVFKGTNIMLGSGRAIVVSIGEETVIGNISKQISGIESEDPLKGDIRKLSKRIIIAVLCVSVLIFILGMAKNMPPLDLLITIVSLSVSMIPEGLPIVLTLVLATGVWRMGKQNVLVKKLQAVESLGQAQIIAVDKTGTITKNELVVQEVYVNKNFYSIEGVGYEPKGRILLGNVEDPLIPESDIWRIAKISALCANSEILRDEKTGLFRVLGDPIEAALLVFSQKAGFNKSEIEKDEPLIQEIAIPSQVKYHALLHASKEGALTSVVGAPEIILKNSAMFLEKGVPSLLTDEQRSFFEDRIEEMTKKGLRVVAVGYKNTRQSVSETEVFSDLIFLGLVGMKDALRIEVKDALLRAHGAGMKVVMITGDHKSTAEAIAREAGILPPHGRVLSGVEIDAMSNRELMEALHHTFVFARVTPEHKLKIIEAYKARGEIVAMTGDGVNDAPPLVAADIGVSMGKIGTEVAKEASDIVLLDDNFGSIVSAVEEGRSIYKTIQKVILYLFSTSLGEVFVILGALILGFPIPILAAQIIWLNFVTDGFLDVSLAMEPKERGLLSSSYQKQQKGELFNKTMLIRALVMSLPMAVGTLWLFSFYFSHSIEKAWTISLTLMAVFQWFNAWNCKNETESIFSQRIFSNKYLIGATALVIGLQMLAVYNPFFQKFLHTVPLSFDEWKIILALACSIVVVEEIRKLVYRVKLAQPRAL